MFAAGRDAEHAEVEADEEALGDAAALGQLCIYYYYYYSYHYYDYHYYHYCYGHCYCYYY